MGAAGAGARGHCGGRSGGARLAAASPGGRALATPAQARLRVGPAARELEALGLEAAAHLAGSPSAVPPMLPSLLSTRCAPGVAERMKRWLSARAWRSVPPAARATSP